MHLYRSFKRQSCVYQINRRKNTYRLYYLGNLAHKYNKNTKKSKLKPKANRKERINRRAATSEIKTRKKSQRQKVKK